MGKPAVADPLLEAEYELRHDQPWLFAKGAGSIWTVTGRHGDVEFKDCLASLLPWDEDRLNWGLPVSLAALDVPLFQVLLDAPPIIVPATAITRAKELLLVHADAPFTVHPHWHQSVMDEALTRRDDDQADQRLRED